MVDSSIGIVIILLLLVQLLVHFFLPAPPGNGVGGDP